MKRILVILAMFAVIGANAQFFAGVEAKVGASNMVATTLNNGFSYFAGVNAGYEFFNHIPVSVGIEYGELNVGNNLLGNLSKQTSLRVPLKIGYCYSFNRLKPFINVGAFYAVKSKMPDMDIYNAEGDLVITNGADVNIDSHFGVLGQIGTGYKLSDKITVSAAYEYNRPFNGMLTVRMPAVSSNEMKEHAYYFHGANIGFKWYFLMH
jgi:outer membrane protein W